MNTSINDKFFLGWRKCKAFLVQTMETMAQGQSDGYLNPYSDFPGDSSFNAFRSKETFPQNGIAPAPQVVNPPKPKIRSETQSVYETGIIGGAAEVDENPDLSAESTALPPTPEAKRAEAEHARMNETEATILVMVVIMLALTVLAFIVLEAKIAR